MIMYMSKGGFRVEVMHFSLYKKSHKLKLVMQYLYSAYLVLICTRPLPRDPNAQDIDICGPLRWDFLRWRDVDWDWKE